MGNLAKHFCALIRWLRTRLHSWKAAKVVIKLIAIAHYSKVHCFYNSNKSVDVSFGYEESQVTNISEKVRKKESSHQKTHYSVRIAIDLKSNKNKKLATSSLYSSS